MKEISIKKSLQIPPALAVLLLMVFMGGCGPEPAGDQVFDPDQIAPFVEPDFPFITTSIDARELGPGFPENNLTPRCLALQLGYESYACFDTDMLRWTVAWTGDFLPMVTMAQVSYRDFHNKNNQIPVVAGDPKIATGLYPGWFGADPGFSDPRPRESDSYASWGPIPAEIGRWNGVYLKGNEVVMSYTVKGTDIYEKPGSIRINGETGFTRTIRTEELQETLTLAAAEVTNGISSEVTDHTAVVNHGENGELVTAIGLKEATPGIEIEVIDNRYITVKLPPENSSNEFTLVLWNGHADESELFEEMLKNAATQMPNYRDGGPPYWTESVHTGGKLAPDTAAYVIDRLTLPVPNPWKRNVRVTDVAFFGPGRAALVTFEGDVWLVDGIDSELNNMEWRRYASGLYEPQSIEIVNDTVYVFGREGIVKFHDLNNDNVADFYENFSNLMAQSIESREWPTDLVADPKGGFYISKFGPLDMGPQTSAPRLMPGFRDGSRHGGSVVKVSPDGRSVRNYATGYRGAYLGINPENGIISASDQQGHFVPSTAITLPEDGDYYGVPATAHRDPIPEPTPPLTWIPHSVDRSGTSQAWITGDKMGPLSGKMVHFSYGRPGLFQVLIDCTESAVQGGVSFIPGNYTAPATKGAVGPHDGQLYITGFNIWDTNARDVSAFIRLRYTGVTSTLPTGFDLFESGLVIEFETALDEETVSDPGNYQVRRWNYQRTEQYGSGHFKLDGTAGEELLPVFSAHRSDDGHSVFLVIPNMEEVMQMAVSYQIQTEDEISINDSFWFTINDLEKNKNSIVEKFGSLDPENLLVNDNNQELVAVKEEPASAERGEQLFKRIGCQGCHSVSDIPAGKSGPPLTGLYNSRRTFNDGTSTVADDAYIRESVLNPNEKIVEGYDEGMPPFRGILTDTEIESVILYIRSLSDEM